MAKYRVKAGHEQDCVCTVAPENRKGNGRFELSKCTQRELRYLHEVVKYPYVELVGNEKAEQAQE